MTPLVSIEDNEGWSALHLDRTDKRNALSHALVDELIEALERTWASGRPVAVVGARGPVFCAGGDRSEVHTSPVAADRLIEHLKATELFMVARVEGLVLGSGVSMLRLFPVVLCSPSARFGLPEARMGNFPVPSAYLEGVIPARRIVEMGVRLAEVGSAEAAERGLATAVVEPDRLDAEVEAWVADVIERPRVADQARRYWQAQYDEAFEARHRWWRELARPVAAEGAR